MNTNAVPPIGVEWPGHGGIYAGIMRDDNGAEYHLIIGPDCVPLECRTVNVECRSLSDAHSIDYTVPPNNLGYHLTRDADGTANIEPSARQRHREQHDLIARPAGALAWDEARAACRALSVDGRADFSLPTLAELALCHANTPALFEAARYWSIEFQHLLGHGLCRSFPDGTETAEIPGTYQRARAVRRIPLVAGQALRPIPHAASAAAHCGYAYA